MPRTIGMMTMAATLALAALAAPAHADQIADFQARYDALRVAMDTRDNAAIKPMFATGFEAVDIDGNTKDLDTSIADLSLLPADPGHERHTIVDNVKVTGDTATVGQHYTRVAERTTADGAHHTLTIQARSTDDWRQVGGAWLLAHSSTRALQILRDGNPVRNTDLDAPAK